MLNEIDFDENEKEYIKKKLALSGFSHNSWADEDLSKIKSKIKAYYLYEQKTICPYCKRNLQTSNGRFWDIEHIIPRSYCKEFMFEPKNLCMACVDCNNAKSDKKVTKSRAKVKYPIKSDLFFIIHPHLDVYEDNLEPIRPGFFYIPKTEKGSKTIEICNLNRFYQSAGFGDDGTITERILCLTTSLGMVKNPVIKKDILKQLAELAIKGIAG